ncbi:MAG: hypothetical protein ACHP7P_02775 [Terriglobales bacterium]
MNTLKRIWAAWKQIAQKIGNFQARVLLTVIYAVLILPFGLAVRLFSDPLRIKRRPEAWLDHGDDPSTIEWARRQW